MKASDKTAPSECVLVSDFDGTMTRHDFYLLAIESLMPADVPDYWAQYRAGTITHFEALRRYFAAIRASEDDVLAVVQRMDLDPLLPTAVESLHRSGWQVVVASAGCDWYIHKLLDSVGVELETYANPGQFEAGSGLIMWAPIHSPYWSPTLGVDKTALVRELLRQGKTVAFAGDGLPDAEPARLVPGELRFARGALADVLTDERLPFYPFETWSDIADQLLEHGT